MRLFLCPTSTRQSGDRIGPTSVRPSGARGVNDGELHPLGSGDVLPWRATDSERRDVRLWREVGMHTVNHLIRHCDKLKHWSGIGAEGVEAGRGARNRRTRRPPGLRLGRIRRSNPEWKPVSMPRGLVRLGGRSGGTGEPEVCSGLDSMMRNATPAQDLPGQVCADKPHYVKSS